MLHETKFQTNVQYDFQFQIIQKPKSTLSDQRLAHSTKMESGNVTGHFQSWHGFLLSSILCFVLILNLKPIWLRFKERKKLVESIDRFPGPPTLPIVGNAHLLLNLLNSETEFLGWTRTLVEKHGTVLRMWIFSKPMIFIASSEIANKLLKEGVIDDKCEEVKNFARAIGAVGLPSVSADVHAKYKKIWSPFFNLRQIENSMPFIHVEGLKLVKQLEQFSGKDLSSPCQEFDLLQYAIRCTFNAVCCLAVGCEFVNTISDNDAKQFIWDLHNVSVNLTRRAFRPWLNKDWIYYNTPEGQSSKRSADRGANLMKEAIKFRRNMRLDPELQDRTIYFVDILLDLHEQGVFTDTQVLSELVVFIGAAYDTTGITVCLVMYFLALYPEHQEKVVQELHQVLGPTYGSNNNYPLTKDTVKMFKYMELCIKESLRLYTLIPVLPRGSTQDIKLEDGKVIPRGVDVHILAHVIHRNPEYFPNPHEFRPERHSEGHNPAFMPFAVGNRNCIGQVMGMLTVKTVVAHLLMGYSWETTEKQEEFKTIYQTAQVPVTIKCKIRKRLF